MGAQSTVREALCTPRMASDWQHLRLTLRPERVSVDSLVVTVHQGQTYRVTYDVRCDARWRVRELHITARTADTITSLTLNGDGQGPPAQPACALLGGVGRRRRRSPGLQPLYEHDADPVRLALQPGDAAELAVVYVALPGLTPVRDGQRYTCLAPDRYRYDSLDDGIHRRTAGPCRRPGARLPGLFRRVGPAADTG